MEGSVDGDVNDDDDILIEWLMKCRRRRSSVMMRGMELVTRKGIGASAVTLREEGEDVRSIDCVSMAWNTGG